TPLHDAGEDEDRGRDREGEDQPAKHDPPAGPARDAARTMLVLRPAAVRVTEALPGGDPIADELLQLARIGEAAALRARPHEVAPGAHLEDPPAPRDEDQLRDLLLERGEELLGDPRRAQEPAALRAVADLDPALRGRHLVTPRRPGRASRPGAPV